MLPFEHMVRYRLTAGLAIILFPITIPILIVLVIQKIKRWLWIKRHVLTREEFEYQLAAEGYISIDEY